MRKSGFRKTRDGSASYDFRKTILDSYASLIEEGLSPVFWAALTIACERVYAMFHLRLKESGELTLEIPPFSTSESKASPTD